MTTTQSYGAGSIGSSPSGSISISGQTTTSYPSAASRSASGAAWQLRARDDDAGPAMRWSLRLLTHP